MVPVELRSHRTGLIKKKTLFLCDINTNYQVSHHINADAAKMRETLQFSELYLQDSERITAAGASVIGDNSNKVISDLFCFAGRYSSQSIGQMRK